MKSSFRLLAAALLLTIAAPLMAVTYIAPRDSELVDRSAMIVRGHVVAVNYRTTASGAFETVATVRVDRLLKGSAVREVRIVQAGGTDGKRWSAIAGAPQYHVGDEGLFFLMRRDTGEWRTYGLGVGKFDVVSANGKRFALRDASDEGMIDDRGVALHDEARVADSFERFIADRVAGSPSDAQYIADHTVTAQVSAQRTIAAASARTITTNTAGDEYLAYNFGGIMARRDNPAVFTLTPNGRAQSGTTVSSSVSAAQAAAGAWNSSSLGSVSITISGSTKPSVVTGDVDGTNNMFFNATAAEAGAGGEGGIAAYTAVYGDVPGHIYETDVFVMDSLPGNSTTLFQEVITHEIGHSLGFRHSDQGTPSDFNAVMNSSVSGSFGANLQCWDKDALKAVYGGMSGCSGAPTISSQPSSQTVPSGTPVVLDVVPANGCSFSYQWYKGAKGDTSNPITAATGSTYNTPQLFATTQYWVRVSNACGTVDSATALITVKACDGVVITSQPTGGTITQGQSLTLSVAIDPSATTPVSYQWYRNGAAIGGATQSTYSATQAGDYFVRVSNNCNTADSSIATVAVSASCVPPTVSTQPASSTVTSSAPVTLTIVAAGSTPLTYQWYNGTTGNTASPITGATSASYVTPAITATSSFWVKVTNACGSANSNTATITYNPPCGAPAKFNVYGPGTTTSAVGYSITWDANSAISNFEVQESTAADFSGATTQATTGTSVNYNHSVTAPTRYYYRARGFAKCNGSAGAYSDAIEVVVAPPPSANELQPNVVLPAGSTTPVTFNYLIMPPPSAKTAYDGVPFSASTDKPWITVTPSTGTIPSGGVNLSVTVNPSTLSTGTSTGTVIVAAGSAPPTNVAVSVSLAAPVTTSPKTRVAAGANALVVPVIGHAQGSNNSLFLSDVRLLNGGSSAMKYLLTYTPSATNGLTTGKQITLDVKAGETKALNDIAKTAFGLGAAGDSAVGVLDIRSATNTPLNPLTTFASSRTYNSTSTGTFGQFIPAIPFTSFVGQGSKLSLQQVAQSDQYRTNVGFVEGAGEPVTAAVRIYNTNGAKVGETTVSLQPFEHKQINNFLAPIVGTLQDGRIEVEATSSTGKISAYASVVDNNTNDPLLVSPSVVGATQATEYVVPGVADLTNANANWRSDVRIFNSASTPVTATLVYYPQGGAAPASKNATIAANGILVLDGVLANFFGITNSGGALHVRTASKSTLVVSARTYDSKTDSNGKKLTYGQFIPAITSSEAVGNGERSLQVLQVEESSRFRSNLGLTEVTGNSVTVELTAYAPDSVATPVKLVTLNGNDFVQLTQVLKQMNFTTSYNARVQVKVVGGNGRVSAYASVVDNQTQDPTYIPAQ